MKKEILNDKNLKQITLMMDKDLFIKLKMFVLTNDMTITKYINDMVISHLEK